MLGRPGVSSQTPQCPLQTGHLPPYSPREVLTGMRADSASYWPLSPSQAPLPGSWLGLPLPGEEPYRECLRRAFGFPDLLSLFIFTKKT